jgi:hypothetical protein
MDFKIGIRVTGKQDTLYSNKTGTIAGNGYIQTRHTIVLRENKRRYEAQRIRVWNIKWDNNGKEELVDEDQLKLI